MTRRKGENQPPITRRLGRLYGSELNLWPPPVAGPHRDWRQGPPVGPQGPKHLVQTLKEHRMDPQLHQVECACWRICPQLYRQNRVADRKSLHTF
jgi:hypothetical protein